MDRLLISDILESMMVGPADRRVWLKRSGVSDCRLVTGLKSSSWVSALMSGQGSWKGQD